MNYFRSTVKYDLISDCQEAGISFEPIVRNKACDYNCYCGCHGYSSSSVVTSSELSRRHVMTALSGAVISSLLIVIIIIISIIIVVVLRRSVFVFLRQLFIHCVPKNVHLFQISP